MPFFALSLASCLVTVVVQHKGGAVASLETLSFGARLANATTAYATYLQQFFWPVHLSVFYPLPASHSDASPAVVSALVLLAVSLVCFLAARRHPYTTVGWLWYLGTLVPVIGLVQVGMQAHADRYTYLPSIGIFLVIAWGLGNLAARFQRPKESKTSPAFRTINYQLAAIHLGAFAAVVALGFATRHQVNHWQSSRTLFQHAVELAPDNYVAWQCLGIADLEHEDAAAALTNFNRGLECAKRYGTEDGNKYFIGAALQLQGKGLEALPYLEQAKVMPEQETERSYRLGLSLTAAKRFPEAETALNQAIQAKPFVPEFQLGLATLRLEQGQTNLAGQLFRQVVSGFPTNAQAHKSLADFLVLDHHPAEAETEYAQAVARDPRDPKMRRAYATALIGSGKNAEAMAQLEEALKLDPHNAKANFDLAELLSQQGRDREAIAHYNQAIAADPDHGSALNNLAWLLATEPEDALRNGPRAVELAQHACELTEWKQPFLIGTLAAAYAEAGRFPEAIAMAEKARDLAQADHLDEVVKRNEQLLQLYRSGKPYRDKGS